MDLFLNLSLFEKECPILNLYNNYTITPKKTQSPISYPYPIDFFSKICYNYYSEEKYGGV